MIVLQISTIKSFLREIISSTVLIIFFNNTVDKNSFKILDFLSEGSFRKVYKVRLKTTGEIFAMKVLNKKYLSQNNQP